MSLSQTTIDTVKATVPVLQEHGLAITSRMYDVLFEKYPETQSMFGNAPKDQPQILATAVGAYAANIDNLGALTEAVKRMSVAHVNKGVEPDHYTMVGDAILTAMKDVLGDAATPQILDAWKDAYFFLANLLIEQEKSMYEEKQSA